MRQAPLIGVTADQCGDEKSKAGAFHEPTVFLHERYCRELVRAGALPLILPAAAPLPALERYFDVIAGLVITGGDFDIHPRYYGETPIPQLGAIVAQRTDFELTITERALQRDLPVLGICGGAQAINVVLGGSLYQDIRTQLPKAGEHQLGSMKERGGHRVRVHQGTLLAGAVGQRTIEVNSTHHQAVKTLGKSLIASASAYDGVIEAIESTEKNFVLGVQWHPEVLAPKRADQRRIISAFIAACKQGMGPASVRVPKTRSSRS